MPGGRPGPALFELLRDKTGTRSDAPARPIAPTPQAPPPPAVVGVAPGAGFDLRQRVSITMSGVWIGVGAAILLAIIAYSVVYKVAYDRGERDATREITKGSGTINEPLRSDPGIPINPALVTPAPPKQSPANGPAAPTGPAPGAPSGDPRIAGYNYLTLASKMDRDMADRAVTFLSENGVRAFAVPVAKTGSSANNASYTLYALQGITREELRARAPIRTDLEEKVARLGKIWQKEHKGQTDFSKTYWDKFGS